MGKRIESEGGANFIWGWLRKASNEKEAIKQKYE